MPDNSLSSNNQNQEENIKAKLLEEYKTATLEGERIDVPKVVEEYQTKFHVPKLMIMKWLNLKTEKSLFTKPNLQSDVSSSMNSSCVSFFTKSENNKDKSSFSYLEKGKAEI